MSGFSSSLPLRLDQNNGIALNKTIQDVVRQNLVNLILTNPGERIMIADFGVGLKYFLFEQNNSITRGEITGKIYEQVEKFMPFVSIEDIEFSSNEDNLFFNKNALFITLKYFIKPIDFPDAITFVADETQNLVYPLDRDDLINVV